MLSLVDSYRQMNFTFFNELSSKFCLQAMGSGSSKEVSDEDRAKHMAAGAIPVRLNVYNLQQTAEPGKPSINGSLGFGFYHSGVEVFSREWAFGGNPQCGPTDPGIFCSPPRAVLPPSQFFKTIDLGFLPPGTPEVRIFYIIREMHPEWLAKSYHLLSKNCNHFSSALVERISGEFNVSPPLKVPDFVNRAARFADVVCPDSVYRSMMRSVPQPPAGQATPGRTPTTRGSEEHSQPQEPQRRTAPATPIPPEDVLKSLPAKELKLLAKMHNVALEGCIEKKDVIGALLEHRQRQ